MFHGPITRSLEAIVILVSLLSLCQRSSMHLLLGTKGQVHSNTAL
ncbi:hypothetical protein KP509_38G013600 [Ceratopteris richardii]|uniref:Uncharacterized protein n=1 Tax=Ceratopteris richardii TaxID=49495 RepID=A0A8T2Q1R7_CERRI|nr:hypothetical protein KP509_38G013600 [Ceratopteris richardii]